MKPGHGVAVDQAKEHDNKLIKSAIRCSSKSAGREKLLSTLKQASKCSSIVQEEAGKIESKLITDKNWVTAPCYKDEIASVASKVSEEIAKDTPRSFQSPYWIGYQL